MFFTRRENVREVNWVGVGRPPRTTFATHGSTGTGDGAEDAADAGDADDDDGAGADEDAAVKVAT